MRTHKGNPGEAYLFYLGIMSDPEFNANALNEELFNEQNFDVEQLLDIADTVSDIKGALVVANHPNATPQVKAKLFTYLLEAKTVASE